MDSARSREWRSKNKDKVSEANRRYHAKKMAKRRQEAKDREVLADSKEFSIAKKTYVREVRAKRKSGNPAGRKSRDLSTKSSIDRLLIIRKSILAKAKKRD